MAHCCTGSLVSLVHWFIGSLHSSIVALLHCCIGSLAHCIVALVHCCIGSLAHCIGSLVHWLIALLHCCIVALLHRFIGSLAQTYREHWDGRGGVDASAQDHKAGGYLVVLFLLRTRHTHGPADFDTFATLVYMAM